MAAERARFEAAPRTTLGKAVRRLRREGLLPANVFGRGLDSTAIQLNTREFVRIARAAGVKSMFEISIEGESGPRYVQIKGLTRAGGMGEPIHVDFYQVDLARPIQMTVPVNVTGEAPAARDLAGTLVQHVHTIAVSCLPLEVPEAVTADATTLKSFDAVVTVGDLKAPKGVDVLGDPAVVVAQVNPPRLRLDAEEE